MGTVYEIVFYLFCRTFFLYTFDRRKENKYQTLKLVLLKEVRCNHRFSRIFREVSILGKKKSRCYNLSQWGDYWLLYVEVFSETVLFITGGK